MPIRSLPLSFYLSLAMVILLVCAGMADPAGFADTIGGLNTWVNHYFGNFYLWFVLLILGLQIVIALSPLGAIRLGGTQAKPEYKFLSWFSMLFCAGMGTGFMFWGAAEPLVHFAHPPWAGITGVQDRQTLALAYTFFHWGLSPWAIYGMTGLAIGFLCFNLDYPFRFSGFLSRNPAHSTNVGCTPRLLIDLLVLMATVFGMAATFGMGVLLVEQGMRFVFGIQPSLGAELLIALAMMAMFFAASWAGIGTGIKRLSVISMWMCLFLLVFVLVCVPEQTLLPQLAQSTQFYLAKLPQMSLGQGAFSKPGWVGQWTVMYWTWWIAWAPFVGVFIALISKGRTLRNVVFGVLVVPTLFSLLWFGVFGHAAILLNGSRLLSEHHFDETHAALILYSLLAKLPFAKAMSLLSLLTVMVFVSHSADSAVYTLAQISDDACRSVPPRLLQTGWGLLFSALAMIMLRTGGLPVLCRITTVAVLPFTALLCVLFGFVTWRLLRYGRQAQTSVEPPLPAPDDSRWIFGSPVGSGF